MQEQSDAILSGRHLAPISAASASSVPSHGCVAGVSAGSMKCFGVPRSTLVGVYKVNCVRMFTRIGMKAYK